MCIVVSLHNLFCILVLETQLKRNLWLVKMQEGQKEKAIKEE
jgi:hypothetical protein